MSCLLAKELVMASRNVGCFLRPVFLPPTQTPEPRPFKYFCNSQLRCGEIWGLFELFILISFFWNTLRIFCFFKNISRCPDMSVGYPKLMPSTKCHFILQNRYNKFVSNEKKPLFYIVRSLLFPVLLANDWRSSLLQRSPNWSVKLASTEILNFQLSSVY